MRRVSTLLVVLCIISPAGAEEARKIATVEGVSEYRLANGARVLLFPEMSRPTITVNMTVLVGSRHEGYGESGMAHLLEHMVFKGTPTFRDVPKALRDHGASFNGTTNPDRTNYFETLPATEENLEFALRLEADRLVNSFVKREDLTSEMTVVRNEFERGENSPQRILLQRVHAAAYEWHNYGKSTIGNRSDIERVPIENLLAFYKKYYQPDNVVMIVAGKFDEAGALAVAQKTLGAIPRAQRKLDATYTEEPAQDGERQVTLRRVGTVGSVAVAYHVPAAAHADWASLSLLGGILSQAPNGRLYKALVESKKATSVFARAGNEHDPSLFVASAEAEPAQLDAARAALLEVLEALERTSFTADEVEKARTRSKRNAELLQSNSSAMAQALSAASALGDWRLLFVQRDRIAAVTAADVNRVARTYFPKHNRTVGVFLPAEKPERLAIAPAPALATIVDNYKGNAVAQAGEAFDPTPANLDSRTKLGALGGIKTGVLTKKNRGETVSMVLSLRYGNEDALKGHTTAAALLPSLMLAGTKQHDRQALREEFDRLGIRITPGTGGFGGGRRGGGARPSVLGQLAFAVEAKRQTLPAAIKLLGEVLLEPAFPAQEFETMKRAARAAASAMQTDPGSLAANRLDRLLFPFSPSDIHYVPTAEERQRRVDEVKLEEVIAVYQKQLGASVGALAVVGDCDADAAVAQVADILKGLKSDVAVQRVARPAPAVVKGLTENILTPDKADATFRTGLAFALKESDADYAALRLGNMMLGGSTLSSRLGNRIRQKEGLSYGVTSTFSASARDPVATFVISATTNPLNIDRLEKAALEELADFLAKGPSRQELADAQKAYLEAQKVGRTSDAALASQIVTNLQLGRTFAHIQDLEKRIAALTPEDVTAAFRRHIDLKKLVIIRAGDFRN